MGKKRIVSMGREITTIAEAVDGARLLSEIVARGGLETVIDSEAKADGLICAVLRLCVARMEMLVSAIDIEPSLDPARLHTSWNAAYPGEYVELTIEEWSDDHLQGEAEQELGRVARRRQKQDK